MATDAMIAGAWLALACAFMAAPGAAFEQSGDARYDSEDDDVPPPRNGFSAKALVGPSFHMLYDHPVGGVMVGAAFGAQFKDIGAIHGTFMFHSGASDEGLDTTSYGGSVTWEHILGRVRPGIGMALQYLELRRATRGLPLSHLGVGPTAFLTGRHRAISPCQLLHRAQRGAHALAGRERATQAMAQPRRAIQDAVSPTT